MAKDEGVVRPGATAPRPTAWMPTGRVARAPGAPWQRAIRGVPQRGAGRKTQTPRWVALASAPLGLPHPRGPEPLPPPRPTPATGSLRPWRPVTPALALASPIYLGDQRRAVFSRLGGMPGSMACHRVPVSALGSVASRQLRDTTRIFGA